MKKFFIFMLLIFVVAGNAFAEDFGVPGDTYNETIDNTVSWVINGDQNTIINVDAGNDAIIGGVGLDDIDKPETDVAVEDWPQSGILYWAENSAVWYWFEFANNKDFTVEGKLYIAGTVHTVHVPPRDSKVLTITAWDKRLGIPEGTKVSAFWDQDPSVVRMIQRAEK